VVVDLDAAWGVVGYLDTTRRAPARFRDTEAGRLGYFVSTTAQPWSLSGDNMELVWIPAVSADGYWLGTFYLTHYDAAGAIDAELIMNVEQQFGSSWYSTWEQKIFERDHRTREGRLSLGGPEIANVSYTGSGSGLIGTNERQFIRAGFRFPGRYGNYLGCSAAWCGGAGVGCGIAHLWNAELLWGPCAAGGCATGLIGCTWGTLVDWQ
jgi:hypothetical protein